MATLVIETATAACSVALIDRDGVRDAQHEIVGRGHAERLIPMIGEVLVAMIPDAILVDCGPGSFTGIRVGIAAARGLALGWGVPVTGYSSLALIAASVFSQEPDRSRLAVILEGGHGEVFMQLFAASPFVAIAPLASVSPVAALDAIGDLAAFGNGVGHVAAIKSDIDGHAILPDARMAALLPVDCRTLPPRPIYGRAPDAQPVSAA